MLKMIGWILKASLFTVLVLIAAHYLTWDGKTVSDQVRSTLASAERSSPAKSMQKKSQALMEDARETAARIGIDSRKRYEAIPDEDRERLQALIHAM